jgi:P4 family phage/plasmid primase-like protien
MDSPSEFRELLSRLGRNDDDLVTICYQSAKQKFTSKSIKVELADSVVSALDALENNIWFEINPSSVNGRATARDIDKLAAVYIDIDYKDSGAGSVKAAREFVELISELIGVGPTATVYSGHGIQPYWAIEDDHMDNALATGVLNRWGAFCRFLGASQGIQLDSVFDLPRIFRAPGSRNFKDASNPVTVMTMLHKNWRPITIDEINDVLIAHGITSEMSLPDEYELVSSASDWEYASHDCQFTPTLYAGVRPTNGAPKSRHGWLLQQMVLINAAHRNGCISQPTKEELVDLVAERFKFFLTQAPQRDMHQGEVQGANKWAIARVETFSPEKLDNELRRHQHSDFFLGDPTSVLGEPSANQDHSFHELVDIYMKSFGTYGRTDAANARRLVYFNQGHYKFVPDLGWFRWENNRFVLDKEKMLFQAAIDAAEFVVQTPANDAQVKWAQSSINKDRIVNAITIAGTDPEVQVQALEMDAQPNDLCTPQGIVNLQTGEIRAPDRRIDLSTRQTTVSPNKISTPLWSGFLKDVLQDEERIAYLQELLGSSLFGDSRFHVLPVLVGSGANGKSTLLDVVAGVLGDYAATMPENFLLDANGAAHPTEIARLRGVRFAMASETRPDGKFNESRVKMLTGGDTLSARFMNQNFFDFKPTHTLFLALNHLPAVKSGGDGFWRRLRKIDFNITIAPEKRKENLAQLMIETEGPGILQWMIEGAVRVTTQGFSEPDSVKAATLTYRHEEDHIAKFVDERIVVAATGTATKTSVFNAYRNWCIDNGEKYITQNALAREIRSRLNVGETDGAGIRMFTGIELVDLGINTESMVDKEEKDEYWK